MTSCVVWRRKRRKRGRWREEIVPVNSAEFAGVFCGGGVSVVSIHFVIFITRVVSCAGVVLEQDEDDDGDEDDDDGDQQPYHQGQEGAGQSFELQYIMIYIVILLGDVITFITYSTTPLMMPLATTLTMSLPWTATHL